MVGKGSAARFEILGPGRQMFQVFLLRTVEGSGFCAAGGRECKLLGPARHRVRVFGPRALEGLTFCAAGGRDFEFLRRGPVAEKLES